MSFGEVGFRVRRKMQATAERAGFWRAGSPAPVGNSGHPWIDELPRGFDAIRYTGPADRVLAGRFDIFALRDVNLGFPPRWNVDPKTGIEAPLLFGKELDYRDPSCVGDIKYLWEINRHLELVTLAQAWHLTRAERFAAGCRTLLESWFEQSPYPRGVNWCVSLEHAVRLVNWAFAWFLLGGDAAPIFSGERGERFRSRWLSSIHQHCHFIAGNWSRHSSANNHLLGEATGLFIAATTWPLWPQSARWQAAAHRELTREAQAQTFEDGVNKEQALWYHHAVADMMLLAGVVARANGCDFGQAYWRRLEAMLEFIASIMDVGGNLPAIGDADEGLLIRFVPGADAEVFRSLLASAAVLFQRADLRLKAQVFDDKSRWLLGDGAEARFAEIDTRNVVWPIRREFADGGYFVLGERFETEREVRIVADAGPLGYLSIAAHGHADALAFTLSVSGRPILVDPGTYAYHTQGHWRRYFKGTSAHNTIVVDGLDQSVSGGNFLWLKHATVHVDEFGMSGDAQILVAEHRGYCRLRDPLRHRRRWRYESANLSVIDELLCAGAHSVHMHWHFAPQCRVSLQGNVIFAERDAVRVAITCPEGLSPALVSARDPAPQRDRGDDGRVSEAQLRPLGWFSTGFDLKVATTTAVLAGEIRGNARFRTDFVISAV